MGFAKRGSKASLVAGGASGAALMWAAADLNSRKPTALVVACVLAVVMGKRGADSGAPMPVGIAASSAALAVALASTP